MPQTLRIKKRTRKKKNGNSKGVKKRRGKRRTIL